MAKLQHTTNMQVVGACSFLGWEKPALEKSVKASWFDFPISQVLCAHSVQEIEEENMQFVHNWVCV